MSSKQKHNLKACSEPKGRASRNMYNSCSLVSQDQKKGKRKLHITAEKNRLQQRKQRQTGPKTNSLHTVESLRRRTPWCCCFPACFARARYSSRMIDRFLNWGDHGKPKSGKIKGRCQPPLRRTFSQVVIHLRSYISLYIGYLFSSSFEEQLL